MRLFLAALLLPLGIYLLRVNDIAGVVVDDAWYLMLARALAEGSGYAIISSPREAILPLYPPGFPAVLSLAYRIHPEFPANVFLLKSVSIVAMLAVGVLTFRYVRTHRQQSAAIAGSVAIATTLVPAFAFLATSTLMSECVFTLAQLAAVVLIHQSVESADRGRSVIFAMSAAAAAAAAVLIRSAAAGLVLAVLLWLIKETHWKRAAWFAGAVAVCLLPWLAYARAHAPTTEQRMEHGGAVAYNYADQFWMRVAGGPAAGRVTASAIPARIGTNFVDVFGRGIGGIFVPAFLRGPNESGEEVVGVGPASMGDNNPMMVVSFALSAIVLAGFIATVRRRITVTEFLVPVSIAIILIWPFWSFRFLLPLTPFLFFYLVTGLEALSRSTRVMRITLFCVIGLYLFDHAGYIVLARTQAGAGRMEWADRAAAVDAALEWVGDNLRPDGTIASTNPALLYMKTGLKSLGYDDPTIPLDAWRARGFRYIVCLYPLDVPAASAGVYKVLYKSPARLWVIELTTGN
jgi:hypothetical protein